MVKVLFNKQGKKFVIKNTDQDYHTQYGFVAKKDLQKDGLVATNTGKELSLVPASFIDLYEKISRDAQIIPRKDLGYIAAELGIGKDHSIVDAGSGSGAAACFFAHIAKKVVSYEIRDDFIAIAEKNKALLGLANLSIKKGDVYESINEKNVDSVHLDVPEPWNALETAAHALKAGGFLVCYSPTIPQVMDLVDAVKKRDDMIFLKTLEIAEKEWEINARKVRPKSQAIGHSGFITIIRKI